MLFPRKLLEIIHRIRAIKDIPIFLYTALYTKYSDEIISQIDGLNFTLHENPSQRDIDEFHALQD